MTSGIIYQMPLTDTTLPAALAVFETNVFAVMALTKAMMPCLVASKGLVVNISSFSDRLPFPFQGVYAMTKAALSSYSRTLSVELAAYDVGVLNAVTAFVTQPDGPAQHPRPRPSNGPADSMFDAMRHQASASGGRPTMLADTYARRVVSEALRGKGWQLGPVAHRRHRRDHDAGRHELAALGPERPRRWLCALRHAELVAVLEAA